MSRRLLILLLLLTPSSTGATSGGPARPRAKTKLVVGVDGGTESLRACCFNAVSGAMAGAAVAAPYVTRHPRPGWAEQDPADWWECLGRAVAGAVRSLPDDSNGEDYEIVCLCVDTTCCSVVALDEKNEPLRPCLLWMDARAATQAAEVLRTCRGDPALAVNSGGEGPLSAEWMTPKALWLRQEEPTTWSRARTVCEYQDFLNYKLTGRMCASACNAATRWHWDGEACLREGGGRPRSLYAKLGISELYDKLPEECLPMGALVGHLTEEAAKHLTLPAGLPVAQGGPDAFVGMVGLGCIEPGQLCLITGSSHLHCVVSSHPTTTPGTWGAYKGAPLPGINFAEGGQSSTGSILRWARNIFGAADVDYKTLDFEAAEIPPGCEGLVALETFQGSRTPKTDPLARGALLGLTLSHTRAHIWRAFMESVCYGTRACIEGLEKAGHDCDEIIIAGGATRSNLWLQMHADISGKPVVVCENTDAPLLGCAVLASVSAGVHGSVKEAVAAMVRTKKRVEPDPAKAALYADLYHRVYAKVGDAACPIAHAIGSLRGGDAGTGVLSDTPHAARSGSGRRQHGPIISPSLLASDWSDIKGEVQRCVLAGVTRLHVDVFDGVFLDSPHALTFGPQMVRAIRRCSRHTLLDLHVCVDRPARYVVPMAEAGGNTFIFQLEAMADETEACELAQAIVGAGMVCGISINPSTSVEETFSLLKSGLVKLVDILAVEPGFGGQQFQDRAYEKIVALAKFREENSLAFDILVDGGINESTASGTRAADILVAGTFLFQHPESLSNGVRALQASVGRSV